MSPGPFIAVIAAALVALPFTMVDFSPEPAPLFSVEKPSLTSEELSCKIEGMAATLIMRDRQNRVSRDAALSDWQDDQDLVIRAYEQPVEVALTARQSALRWFRDVVERECLEEAEE